MQGSRSVDQVTFQKTEETRMSSSSGSESDDEVKLLRNLSLEGFGKFTQPVTSTGFIYHEKMAEHKCEWDPNYPENPQRTIKPYQRCQELGLVKRCQELPIRYATEDEIVLKHTLEHVHIAQSTVGLSLEETMALCEKYDAWYANKVTYEASLIAAGSTISLVEQILQDRINNGFAMVRPPGHHAMEQEFNGYCTFNNVAVAAQYALNSGIDRILIVDWDVHHGQGTQRMFYDDPRVLYFSIHRYEYGNFWPNLRESDYDFVGKGKGEGFNINIPLNKTGMTDSDYMAVFNMVLMPVAYEFQPQLVLISSGYDAAVGCFEGEMLVTPAMYAQMTFQLMTLAAGRVCVVLEGGYCIKSLAEGCALTLRSLLRDPCPRLPPLKEPSDSILTTILNVIKILRKFWSCFRHHETVEGSEECPYPEVNSLPPVPGAPFMTPENRPDKFQISDCYPVQAEQTRLYFSDLINKLIAETNLSCAKYRCCYVFDAEMRSHRNLFDKSHPERPERISRIYAVMAEWKLLSQCLNVASRLARKSELLWIHGEDYINRLLSSQSKAESELKEFPSQHKFTSIYLHQKSLHCALLSCGSLLNVVEAVLRGEAQSGVAVVRPPGHHAEAHEAMGFCFFNNVAIAARFAQQHFGLKRILILDWDVHHGNATQHQFYRDPSVLYISLHRFDGGNYFPGKPDADYHYTGSGAGEGFNINIPWSYTKMGDAEYISAFTQIVMPVAHEFAPELVLVSAGFDCAVGDPLGGYHVTSAGFGHMTHMLMGLANGRVVLALEGGYNLNSLSVSMATCLATLLGYPCVALPTKLAANDRAVQTIHDVIQTQKKYWSSLRGFVPIPSVRRVDSDNWVIHKENGVKTRSAGASKSALEQRTNKPRTGVPPRAAHFSTSDNSLLSNSQPTTTTSQPTSSQPPNQDDTVPTSSAQADQDSTQGSTQSTGNADTSTTVPGATTSSDAADSTEDSSSNNRTDPQLAPSSQPPAQGSSLPPAIAPARTITDTSRSQGNPNQPPSSNSKAPSASDVQEAISQMKDLSIDDAGTRPDLADLSREQTHPTLVAASESSTNPAIVRISDVEHISSSIPVSPAISFSTVTQQNEDGKEKTEVQRGSGGDGKVRQLTTGPVFVSLVYGDQPDPEPLSLFAGQQVMASQEDVIRAGHRSRGQPERHVPAAGVVGGDSVDAMSGSQLPQPSNPGDCPGGPVPPQTGSQTNPATNEEAGGGGELLGACGGSNRPNTVQELVQMQGQLGLREMHAVQPLPWCPHLVEVRPLPQSQFSPDLSCHTCGDSSENWICLTCYSVGCSRFVQEHMLMHKVETDHNIVLSFSDLSVWCYSCDQYLDNEVLFPMKSAAHQLKFGEPLMQLH